MHLELIPHHPIHQGRLNVIITPADRFIDFFNESLNFQRFTTLYICGTHSRILRRIDTTLSHFDIQRAFTIHQLLTVLKETCHTIVIIEHDPSIYERDQEMRGFIWHGLQELSQMSIVILYAAKMDRSLATLLKGVNSFFLYGGSEEYSQEGRNCMSNDRWRSRIGVQETLKGT